MANNHSSLLATDGQPHDWVELYNDGDQVVDLGGWALTDTKNNLNKWVFPSVQLAPRRYLIVFASGRDVDVDGESLHANFRLDADGEYLALVDAAQRIVQQYEPGFPRQYADVSFGFDPVERTQTHMTRPTPGVRNLSSPFTPVANVTASHASGFFDDAFEVQLLVETSNAVIRYTLDGSRPELTAGIQYQVPLRIRGTTTVRAAAFYNGVRSEQTTTLTFLFFDDILNQNNDSLIANGYPAVWDGRLADYEMDRRIIGGRFEDAFAGKYAATIRDDLISLPSLSLVTTRASLFDNVDGIYTHPLQRGAEWERPVSVELLDPSGAEAGFQVDAGLRIQGGITRLASAKKSLRLIFRRDYGAAELNYPLYGPDAANQFNSVVLRASSGEPVRQLIRDTNLRETQLALGQVAPHGRYVHLYLNGLYWGLYEMVERPDETFHANYFGGNSSEWDVFNSGFLGAPTPGEIVAGNYDAWQTLVGIAERLATSATEDSKTKIYYELQGRRPDGSNDPQLENYLDVDNYIDYLIAQWYMRNTDWPARNYYIARRRGPESTGFKFMTWDGDFSIGIQGPSTFLEPAQFGQADSNGPAQIFPGLFASAAFRDRFQQRLQQHIQPGAALYVDPANPNYDPSFPDRNVPADRYLQISRGIEQAIVAESARWGDADLFGGNAVTLTRDEVWLPRIEKTVAEFFNSQHAEFLSMMERNGLYDSAFVVPPRPNVVISEVHYHPANPTAAERQLNTEITAEDFEFIELFNRSNVSVNLQDFAMVDGVQFRFPNIDLAAGAYAVVVSNEPAFRSRYGLMPTVLGSFDQGQLSNAGERISLVDDYSQPITAFVYDDEASGWPQRADGEGFSLELLDARNVAVDVLMHADRWRLSAELGGSPGRQAPIAGDANLDGLFNSADFVLALTTNRYERSAAASWSEGDWDRDGRFDSRDLVAALVAGRFEVGE